MFWRLRLNLTRCSIQSARRVTRGITSGGHIQGSWWRAGRRLQVRICRLPPEEAP